MPLDYVLDYAPSGVIAPTQAAPSPTPRVAAATGAEAAPRITDTPAAAGEQWDSICFYITPIGEEGSEARSHADLFLGSTIEPALEEFDLRVIRADKIGAAGMISRQVIEHIMRARLVIADLSFHNPNVFYELALRMHRGYLRYR
jgi:hypothetical protein